MPREDQWIKRRPPSVRIDHADSGEQPRREQAAGFGAIATIVVPRAATQVNAPATADPQRLPGRLGGAWWARLLAVAFATVAIQPVLQRLANPTIHADDIVRLVDTIEHPLRELLLNPYNEHTAVCFNLTTWSIWQLIGHDLRLAPLAYSAFAGIAWSIVLGLCYYWLVLESGSPTAAAIATAAVAQSPLVLETAWWYSASSFACAAPSSSLRSWVHAG